MDFGWGLVVGVPGLADVDLGVEQRVTQPQSQSLVPWRRMWKEAPGSANLRKGLQQFSGFLGQLLASQKIGCTWRESESHVPMGVEACKLGLKAHLRDCSRMCSEIHEKSREELAWRSCKAL